MHDGMTYLESNSTNSTLGFTNISYFVSRYYTDTRQDSFTVNPLQGKGAKNLSTSTQESISKVCFMALSGTDMDKGEVKILAAEKQNEAYLLTMQSYSRANGKAMGKCDGHGRNRRQLDDWGIRRRTG